MTEPSHAEVECLLIIEIAQQELQRLASDADYQGMAADDPRPAELGGAQCPGLQGVGSFTNLAVERNSMSAAPLIVRLGHLA